LTTVNPPFTFTANNKKTKKHEPIIENGFSSPCGSIHLRPLFERPNREAYASDGLI
jgi:hypothetical protein